MGGERNEWHGQSVAAPVPSLCASWGAARKGKAQRPFERVAEPTGGRKQRPGSPAARGGSPAAQRPLERGCTDRSAGGCADRRTDPSARARALGGLDDAEASPRRCKQWRGHGRWWRGPAACDTARPCRSSAMPAGPLTAARSGVPGKPLGREPRLPAPALRQRLAAPARAAPCRCLGRPRRL